MAWPETTDYNEAIQNPQLNFADPELKLGKAAVNPTTDMPIVRSGNFADVYEVRCTSGKSYAVKCFTREVKGLQQRYHTVSDHLKQVKLPFTVDFQYLDKGVLIKGNWFAVLKMRWVEGLTLNQFVQDHLEQPQILERLANMWVKLAQHLRKANMAHADLQHGNVLLVSGKTAASLGLRLIDYDGMFVPALAKSKSGEVGHPNFQHPERIANGIYNAEVDRFSHLVIYAALRCLAVGGKKLWQDYDNGDNLLFREADLCDPGCSALFQELWKGKDPTIHTLTGQLILACRASFDQVPLLDDVLANGTPTTLNADQEKQIRKLLKAGASKVQKPPTGAPPPAPAIDMYKLKPPEITPATSPLAGPTWQPPRPPSYPPPAPARRKALVYLAQALSELNGEVVRNVMLALPGRFVAALQERRIGRAVSVAFIACLIGFMLSPFALAFVSASNVVAGTLTSLFGLVLFGAVFGGMEGNQGEGPPGSIPGAVVGGLIGAVTALVLGLAIGTLGGFNDVDEGYVVVARFGGMLGGMLLGAAYGLMLHQTDMKQLWKAGGILWLAAIPFMCITPVLRDLVDQGKDTVQQLVVSADGKTAIAAGGSSKVARIWDVASGRELKRLFGHNDTVSSVAMTPDGQLALTGSWDKTIQLWNTAKGLSLAVFSQADSVYAVALTPDGKRALAGGADKAITMWDLKTDQKLWTLPNFAKAVQALAVSPDGRFGLTANDNSVYLFKVQTGEVVKWFDGHSQWVRSVAFSADGKKAVSGGSDRMIHLWDLEKGELLRRLGPHPGEAAAVAFSPNGHQVISAGALTVVLWDVPTGQEIHRWRGHRRYLTSVAFMPDGQKFLSGSADHTLRLWDIQSGEEVARLEGEAVPSRAPTAVAKAQPEKTDLEVFTFQEDAGNVRHIAFSPDGKTLLSANVPVEDTRPGKRQRPAYTASLKLWAVNTGRRIWESQLFFRVVFLSISGDGRRALLGGAPNTLALFDVETGKEVRQKTLDAPTGEILAGTFIKHGKRTDSFVYVHSSGTIVRWDWESPPEVIVHIPNARQPGAFSTVPVAFTPDGRRAVYAQLKGLSFWDLEKKRQIGHLFAGGSVLAISPDGKLVLLPYSGWRGPIGMWDVAQGREVKRFLGHRENILVLAFSSSGKRAMSVAGNGHVLLCEEPKEFWLHPQPTALAISPDGRYAAVGSTSGPLRLLALPAEPPDQPLQLPGGQFADGQVSSREFPTLIFQDRLSANTVLKTSLDNVHELPMVAGRIYTIDMMSPEFVPYLQLRGPRGKEMDSDDDRSGKLNARIVFRCPAAGTYRIIVNSLTRRATGAYVLKIQQ